MYQKIPIESVYPSTPEICTEINMIVIANDILQTLTIIAFIVLVVIKISYLSG